MLKRINVVKMRKLSFVLITIFFVLSCGVGRKDKTEGTFTKDELKKLWFFGIPDNLDSFVNHVYSKDSILSFKYPDSWNYVSDSEYEFIASLKENDINEFVVVIKHSKVKSPVKNLNQYLSEINNQLISDTFELLEERQCYELSLNDKKTTVLFCEFETRIINSPYHIITCYFDDEEFIYDVSMKKNNNDFSKTDYLNFLSFLKLMEEYNVQKFSIHEVDGITSISFEND